jgi:hypothetical protein
MFLKAFSPSDIYEFLTRWPFSKDGEQSIPRIYKELTDRPTLREMCSNPLILSMYVAEDQAAGHTIAPETRTEFYTKVSEELIIRRRLQQTGPAPAATKLREQRQRILGRLAFEHLLNTDQPTNSLQWSDALRVVAGVMSCSESEAESIFRDLAKETGLVTEERIQQTFRFIHLTLCEFLAAFEAVQGQEAGWVDLINAHKNLQSQEQPQLRSRLVEVIPFACGLLPRVKRYDALGDVIKIGDNHLLALSFLETKSYDHPGWPAFVTQEKESLLSTPEDNWDERWLRQLHLFNVVVRDANSCATHLPTIGGTVDLALFFRTLVEKQQSSLSTLLSAYATQDAAAAFRLAEICNLDLARDFPEIIVSNCDQIPFFALVREQALRELERIELWASLLSEAALRSRVVANWMDEIEPAESLQKFVEQIPTRMRWSKRRMVSQSLYTQFLSISVGARSESIVSLPLLRLVRKLPAPGSPHVNANLLFVLGPFLVLLFGFNIFQAFSFHLPSGFMWINLLMVVLYLIILRSIVVRAILRDGYAEILQVGIESQQVNVKSTTAGVKHFFPLHLLFGIPRAGKERFLSSLGKKYMSVLEELTEMRESGSYSKPRTEDWNRV